MIVSKFYRFVLPLTIMMLAATVCWAVGGSVSGTVKDSSGGVIPGAMLTLMNTSLGSQFRTTADSQGLYSFPNMPVGRYDLTMEAPGFRAQKKSGLVVDADSALQVNAVLEVQGLANEVSVTTTEEASEVHVETVATQLGEVVSDIKMTNLSLNGRSYTDLLAIQPGVAPITTLKPNSVIMAGVVGTIAPSGELSAGNVSISRAERVGQWFPGEWQRCAAAPPDRWLEHFRHNPPGDGFSCDDVRQYRQFPARNVRERRQ